MCGHYEGIDQRVIDTFGDEEISIGDYVLTGGELASLVVADSVLRLQPGVLAEEKGYQDESYWDGLLEYPQFTRPEVWEGQAIPPVLLTGDHNKIDAWRGRQSRERTRQRRPDLYDQWCATHPITQIPRWKRTERAQLIKTDAQLDAAAKLFAEAAAPSAGMCAPKQALQNIRRKSCASAWKKSARRAGHSTCTPLRIRRTAWWVSAIKRGRSAPVCHTVRPRQRHWHKAAGLRAKNLRSTPGPGWPCWM